MYTMVSTDIRDLARDLDSLVVTTNDVSLRGSTTRLIHILETQDVGNLMLIRPGPRLIST